MSGRESLLAFFIPAQRWSFTFSGTSLSMIGRCEWWAGLETQSPLRASSPRRVITIRGMSQLVPEGNADVDGSRTACPKPSANGFAAWYDLRRGWEVTDGRALADAMRPTSHRITAVLSSWAEATQS